MDAAKKAMKGYGLCFWWESGRAQRREREVSGGRVGGKTWNSYMSHREQSSKPVLRMEWKTFRRCWIVSYNSVVSAMEQSI